VSDDVQEIGSADVADLAVAGGAGTAADATADTETPVDDAHLIEEADAALAAAERSLEKANASVVDAEAAVAKAKAEREALA